jgi:hypothetical protein
MDREVALPLVGIFTGIVALAGLGWVLGKTGDTLGPEPPRVSVGVQDTQQLARELDDVWDSERTFEEKEHVLSMYVPEGERKGRTGLTVEEKEGKGDGERGGRA